MELDKRKEEPVAGGEGRGRRAEAGKTKQKRKQGSVCVSG